MKTEQLGIIKNASFGCRDTNKAALWLDVELLDGNTSLRVDAQIAIGAIESHGVTDVKYLAGTGVVVYEENDFFTFGRFK